MLIKVENSTPILNADVSNKLTIFEKQLKEIKQQEEIIKQAILSEMEAENILSIETDDLKISYVAPFDRETFDTKTFQKENQELYDSYVKMTPVKSSIRIKLKE